MKDDRLLEPIKYYNEYLRSEIENKLEDEFENLVQTSGVDKEKNSKEVEEYFYNKKKATTASKSKKTQKRWLIFLSIAFFLFLVWSQNESSSFYQNTSFCVFITILYIILVVILFIKMSNNKDRNEEHSASANEALDRAKEGMECFFNLFNEERYIEITESILPSLRLYKIIPKSFEKYLNQISNNPFDDFDYYFSTQTDEDSTNLLNLYGTIEGKPFIFLKEKTFEMGEKTYTGSNTLPYTESYRDSDGHWHTETYYETISASITMPCPMYNSSFVTLFFTDTAPNLHFDRHPFKYNNSIDGYVYSTVKKLNKKEKKEGITYLADKEFEALFNALERNNDIEFRMLFTPYVIKNMKELIRSQEGPGNNFDYLKRGRMSAVLYKDVTVYDDHIVPSCSDVLNYSLEDTRKAFVEKGLSFFDSLYFTLAPILTIKLNTDGETVREEKDDINSLSFIKDNYKHPFNAESLVSDNVDYVRPLGTSTDVVSKAKFIESVDDVNIFEIASSSFSVESKWETQYVVGFHVSGYVSINYDEYFGDSTTNYLLSSYLGLPSYFVRNCMNEFKDDKLVYKNGFLGLIVENVSKKDVERYRIIVETIQAKAEGGTNGK